MKSKIGTLGPQKKMSVPEVQVQATLSMRPNHVSPEPAPIPTEIETLLKASVRSNTVVTNTFYMMPSLLSILTLSTAVSSSLQMSQLTHCR